MSRTPSLHRAAKRLGVGQKALQAALKELPGPQRKLTMQQVQFWEADPPKWLRDERARKEEQRQKRAAKRHRDAQAQAHKTARTYEEVVEMIEANDARLSSAEWLNRNPEHQHVYANIIARSTTT